MNRAERRRQEKRAKKSARARKPLRSAPSRQADPSRTAAPQAISAPAAREFYDKAIDHVSGGNFAAATDCFKKALEAQPDLIPDLACFEAYLLAAAGDLASATCNEMVRALYAVLQGTSLDIRIPPVCIYTIHLRQIRLADDPDWCALVEAKRQALSPTGFDNRLAINRHIGYMGLAALVYGPDFALCQMMEIFSAAPVAIRDAGLPARSTNVLTVHTTLSDHAFWFSLPLPQTRARLAAAVEAELQKGKAGCGIIILLHLMGLLKKSAPDWLDFLFTEIILPTLNQAVELARHDAALGLEALVYMTYVQKFESKDHYRRTMSQIWPPLRAMGKAYGAQLPKANGGHPPQGEGTAMPVVAFYLHSSGILGHTEVFLSFLRGLKQQKTQRFVPLIYMGNSDEGALTAEFDALDVAYVGVDKLDPQSKGYAQTWAAVRRDCRERRVEAICFVSLVTEMAFAFAMGVAPVQIWWSMKYHGLAMPEIDGYLALGSFQKYKMIDGRQWRVCHRSLGKLYDANLTEQADALRRQFGAEQGKVILGCVGREDKLRSEPYIDALAQILARVPNAVYLWTGRTQNPDVLALMNKYNITDRCQFVGWVDTRLYAQVIDVVVDSFPFASGLTGFESMAAGHPVVALVTPEAMGTAYVNHMWPGYTGTIDDTDTHREIQNLFTAKDGTSLIGICETVEDYVNTAIRLATDDAFRTEAGRAAQQFVARYMHDDARMAETFTDHVLEIIDDQSKKQS